jgi:hypothetical protein
MTSEPYKTDDGRWWVKNEEGALSFATSEEAYSFYRRLVELDERMHRMVALPPTELTKPGPPRVIEPVRVDPIPPPDLRTREEKIRDLESAIELELAKIELKEAKSGKIPLTFIVRSWWKLLAAGVGGGLMGYFIKGCS